MILDINGHGKAWIGLERLKGRVELNMETYTKNSNKFFRVKNLIPELQVDHCTYDFENLFDGNQQLSDTINQVLNDNWREIFDEQEPGFLKAIGASLLNLINKLFAQIPIHTMFLG
ncbi:hypothetical protein WA026_002199 [Henosepilachna vigintioctopunctata]|uniref:Protein takeout n=1 Tax=Henosepilachna vigintioctopunctata TaxID=420089 RepID=A0AAW1U0G6_9CUCU